MKSNAYSALAPHYEKLITSCDYEQWSQYVYNKVNEYAPIKKGCDLACGSGYFTRYLKRQGIDIYGVDQSQEMLLEAQSLSIKEKVPVDYQNQDIKKFKSFEKLGFITVINDGINYLSQSQLQSAFKRFASNLVKGGALIFDISSEYKLKNILGDNLYCEDRDEITYIWFNTFLGDSVKMDLTFFTKDGEKYVRSDESHVQYIHNTEEVKNALYNAGFDVVEISGHLGAPLTEDGHRVNFVAVKK
ncbi:MAG: class I SAM-dependent methyltransferase [Clostridiales bacterium]|nr:class I SAM-dependent methyltransferase [Clostridiales bacterium]